MKTIVAFFASIGLIAGSTVLADTEAPELVSIAIDPGSVDVTSSPQPITVTLQITDDDSGMQFGNLYLYDSTNTFVKSAFFDAAHLADGDSLDGTYEVEVEVPRWVKPGTWRIDLDLVDAAENFRQIGPTYDPFPVPADATFAVINTGTVDATAPALGSSGIAPDPVDAAGAPAEITVTLQITDSPAGFQFGFFYFSDPDGFPLPGATTFFDADQLTDGDELDGTYTLHVTLPQGVPTGTWTTDVSMLDRAGNSSFVPGPTFTVGTAPPSLFAAFLDQYDLSGNDALPGADPDRDGKNNATELMLGTDPTDAADAGAGLLTLTGDATSRHLDFTIDPLLSVAADGLFLELSAAGGGAPLRLTGQKQAALGGTWTNVLPTHLSGSTYRISLPLAGGPKGFARLFFQDP